MYWLSLKWKDTRYTLKKRVADDHIYNEPFMYIYNICLYMHMNREQSGEIRKGDF